MIKEILEEHVQVIESNKLVKYVVYCALHDQIKVYSDCGPILRNHEADTFIEFNDLLDYINKKQMILLEIE